MNSSPEILKKQSPSLRLSEIGDKVFEVNNKGRNYYIKTDRNGYPDIKKEYQAYRVLKQFLRMPKVHLSNLEKTPVLFSSPASGESLDKTTKSLEELRPSLDTLVNDIGKLWELTKTPNKSLLVRDCIKIATNTSRRILDSENVNHQLTHTLYHINKSLNSIELPYCVLGHGDEHSGNIFVDTANQNYSLIDPNSAGYYLPIDTLNVLLGGYYLFEKDYEQVNQEKEQIIKYLGNKLILMFEQTFKLRVEDSGLAEVLFINLVRGYYGVVNPKNKIRVRQNKEFYLPIAFEILNNIREFFCYGNISYSPRSVTI